MSQNRKFKKGRRNRSHMRHVAKWIADSPASPDATDVICYDPLIPDSPASPDPEPPAHVHVLESPASPEYISAASAGLANVSKSDVCNANSNHSNSENKGPTLGKRPRAESPEGSHKRAKSATNESGTSVPKLPGRNVMDLIKRNFPFLFPEVDKEKSSTSSGSKSDDGNGNRECPLFSLPVELIEYILGQYLTFDEVSRMRAVCRFFKMICDGHLNHAFTKLQTKMQTSFQAIKSQMPRRESARRKHPLARECDIIETVHMRLTLLQMTFGRHIDRHHCCFFPGAIIDEVYRILRYIKDTPNLGRAYKVTDELFDLSTMAMEYFKDKVEPSLPEVNYFATEYQELIVPFKAPINLSASTKSLLATSTPTKPQTKVPQPKTPSTEPAARPAADQRLKRHVRYLQCSIIRQKRDTIRQRAKVLRLEKQSLDLTRRLVSAERRGDEQERKLTRVLEELQKCQTELRSVKQLGLHSRVTAPLSEN